MTNREHILIVDDEPAIRLFLGEELSQAGYRVTTAASGEEALIRLEEEVIDLVLLDLKMDGMDGLQVMAKVEQRPLPPVVILLTAHASLDSAIEAMRRGGRDYLLKPCRTEQLLTSVEKGLARRREAMRHEELLHLIEASVQQLQAGPSKGPAQPAHPGLLKARGLILDREQHTASCRGRPLHLTPTEFCLLLCLMEHADQVVPLRELMEVLHGSEGEKWEVQQALNTHLWRLRKKLGNDQNDAPYIVNVRSQGYKFVGK